MNPLVFIQFKIIESNGLPSQLVKDCSALLIKKISYEH